MSEQQTSTTVSLISPEPQHHLPDPGPLKQANHGVPSSLLPNREVNMVNGIRTDQVRPEGYLPPLQVREGANKLYEPVTGRPERDRQWSTQHHKFRSNEMTRFYAEMQKEMDKLVKDVEPYSRREIGTGDHRMVVLTSRLVSDAQIEVIDTISGQDEPVRMIVFPVLTEQGWAMLKIPRAEDVRDPKKAAKYEAMHEAISCIVGQSEPTDGTRQGMIEGLSKDLHADERILNGINEPHMSPNGRVTYREPGFYNFPAQQKDLQGAMAVSFGRNFYVGEDGDFAHSYVVGMPSEIATGVLQEVRKVKQTRSPLNRVMLAFNKGLAGVKGIQNKEKM